MITAKIIADSKNNFSNRITTMVVTMPRFILAEFNTHRMFSRNSASSRAIPFEKMVKSVQENPFIPIAWQRDHKGMQGTEYLDKEQTKICEVHWLASRDESVERAKIINATEVTKQLCNRLLEPFMWHTVIISATEFSNFFALRCPQYEFSSNKIYRSWKDLQSSNNNIADNSLLNRLQSNKGQAEIHMMALAEAMWDAMNESTPKVLKAGEWHIPFGDQILDDDLDELFAVTSGLKQEISVSDQEEQEIFWKKQDKILLEYRIKTASANCARVSYTVVGEEDKKPNYENDIKLHDRLVASGHWSPLEHCAQVMSRHEYHTKFGSRAENPIGNGWSGNFRGFIQYRKTFNNENITKQ